MVVVGLNKVNKAKVIELLDSAEYYDAIGLYVFGYQYGQEQNTETEYENFYTFVKNLLRVMQECGVQKSMNGYELPVKGKTITVMTYADEVIGFEVASFDVRYRINFYAHSKKYTVNVLSPVKRSILGGVLANVGLS